MRTKVLICAAVMAASLASSMAQNVYSLNVVGYVNVTLPPQANYLVANPLDATMGGTVTGGNNITNLFPVVPAGSTILTFNPANAQWGTSSGYSVNKSGIGVWSTPITVNPGLGVMFHNPATTNCVVTFVGQVEQGPYTVATLGASQFYMAGAPVPIGGDLTNALVGLAPHSGDTVQTFNSANGQWATLSAGYSINKSGIGVWSANLQIAPGQGFIYHNTGPANTWTSNFTVQ
jgi:hypothetical protein